MRRVTEAVWVVTVVTTTKRQASVIVMEMVLRLTPRNRRRPHLPPPLIHRPPLRLSVLR